MEPDFAMESHSCTYDYDLFISYKRSQIAIKWIKLFRKELKKWLEVEMGRKATVFWDKKSIQPGERWRDRILGSLIRSKCCIAVLSGPYFNSPWCTAEWDTFMQRASKVGKDLIVPIQWHDGNSYRKDARELQIIDFRDFAITAPAFRESKLFIEFQKAIKRLAPRLVDLINNAADCRTDWPVVDPDDRPTGNHTNE
jgi:hypothetical protein